MTQRLFCLLTLLLTWGLLTPHAALAVDNNGGCSANYTTWTFMQGDTHLSINNTNSTTAMVSASAACSQTWSQFSNHVTPVGSWWPEVQQGFTTWLLWCKVCIEGNAPVFSNDTFETPVSIDGAIQIVQGRYNGKIVSAELVNISKASSCSQDPEPISSVYVVSIVEDNIMRRVQVDSRTGEMTDSE